MTASVVLILLWSFQADVVVCKSATEPRSCGRWSSPPLLRTNNRGTSMQGLVGTPWHTVAKTVTHRHRSVHVSHAGSQRAAGLHLTNQRIQQLIPQVAAPLRVWTCFSKSSWCRACRQLTLHTTWAPAPDIYKHHKWTDITVELNQWFNESISTSAVQYWATSLGYFEVSIVSWSVLKDELKLIFFTRERHASCCLLQGMVLNC